MMAADYRHIGGVENRLGRHYSPFSPFSPTPALADQSLALRKSWNAGSNRRSQASTREISAGSADNDNATRFAPGGNAANIALARSADSSRGNAPSPTRTPMWSTPTRGSATASSGV